MSKGEGWGEGSSGATFADRSTRRNVDASSAASSAQSD